MAYCEICGKYCTDDYKYCKKCSLSVKRVRIKANERKKFCRGCGVAIKGRYCYCLNCANRKGFIKNYY